MSPRSFVQVSRAMPTIVIHCRRTRLDAEAAADRVDGAEVPARHALVDDGGADRAFAIACVERAPVQNRNLHRLEEARSGPDAGGAGDLRRPAASPIDRDPHPGRTHRQTVRRARRLRPLGSPSPASGSPRTRGPDRRHQPHTGGRSRASPPYPPRNQPAARGPRPPSAAPGRCPPAGTRTRPPGTRPARFSG